MAKNTISNISNAFSTGNGGGNFEQRIQAMFLLLLITNGLCPEINERIVKVCFQAKYLGYDVDDLVVYTDRNVNNGKLMCQIKHKIIASRKDKTFQNVICSAWNDFNKESFDKDFDRIALATAVISNDKQKSLRFLHEQAKASIDETDFFLRIKTPIFSNQSNIDMIETIIDIIEKRENYKPSDAELWMFFKVFVLLVFDMDCEESINRILAKALIQHTSEFNASMVWAKLLEYVGYCNQSAAVIGRECIETSILELFSIGQNRIVQEPVAHSKQIEDSMVLMIALIEKWFDTNEYDRKIVEKVIGMDYVDLKEKSYSLIKKYTEYIRFEGGRWRVLHKEELLEQNKSLLFDDCVGRVINAIYDVFSHKNILSFDNTTSIRYDSSYDLRKGLLSSLCWINKELETFDNCNHIQIRDSIRRLVRNLLRDGKWTTWVGLRDCMQFIAELAPDIFLESIEDNIISNPNEILRLFPKESEESDDRISYITELLWAIETVAWSPDYLVSAIRVLGLLESLPYENGKWGNTPLNSIVSILLPWYPQSLADIEKRKNALRCLKIDNEEVLWSVLKKMLPNQTHSTSSNPKPKYILQGIPEDIRVSSDEMNKMYAFNLDMAVRLSKHSVLRLTDLTYQIENMNKEISELYFSYIEDVLEDSNDNQKADLWLGLRRIYNIANIKGNTLENVKQLVDKLKPQRISVIHRELYIGYNNLDDGDFAHNWNVLEQKKQEAIREIYDQYGIDEVIKFGEAVHANYDVANKLGYSLTEDEFSDILDDYCDAKINKEFFKDCLMGYMNEHRAGNLCDTSLYKKEKSFIRHILLLIPFRYELFEVVDKLLPHDVQYWEKVKILGGFSKEQSSNWNALFKKLKECGRYATAINVLGWSDFQGFIKPLDVYELLKLAGTEESCGGDTLDNYAVQRLIAWLQKQDCISLDMRSDIEFIYLPIIDMSSIITPLALYTRISTEADYFCSLLELFCKDHRNSEAIDEEYNAMHERLVNLFIQFKVVPGVEWNGDFNELLFEDWLMQVKLWSKQHDCFDLAMETVGSGLAYTKLDVDKLPQKKIIKELNKAENEKLRRGYYLGFIHKQSFHWVDPKGVASLEAEADFRERAEIVEREGYSRYAELLRDIADYHKREAECDIKYGRKLNEE